ncbi:hypothetical protein Poli38472_006029 [Pythium oligandrum]|uniref:Uncharacterized protein n=1 Tax=Pythium oligandrum TaxID=41045 RepID=A0A8K1CTZ0_PYTOL|nr:hypothetical protein Poli38472_006029 [Pythium oligandrum]|eukprot:TMW68561.1 hypothetical protein Poli38472_006029 [Pythium oligandrum]
MGAERIQELEEEVEALKEAQDALYKQHANEKAQMQLAIEQEKIRVAELMEANAAYQEENEQWRLSYEALEMAKRESDDQAEQVKRELEDKVAYLEESVKNYTTQLVTDLEELEKEKSAGETREQVIVGLQQQINEGNDRFAQLTTEYDALAIAYQQLDSHNRDREQHFATQEAELRAQIQAWESQVANLERDIRAISQDDQVKSVNQNAIVKKAEEDLQVKDQEIDTLARRIQQMEEEISLLTLTGGGDGRGNGANMLSMMRDLQQQVYQKSQELVEQGEKHLGLAGNYETLKQQYQDLKQEFKDARSVLLRGIIGDDVDGKAYEHVKIVELVRLRLKALEHELRLVGQTATASSGLSRNALDEENEASAEDLTGEEPSGSTYLPNLESFSAVESFGPVGRLERALRLSRSRNKRLQERIDRLEGEVDAAMNNHNEFQNLKEKMIEAVSRERVEKELRARTEFNLKEATDKIMALSEHIEKLMVHLKHEAAAKTKAIDSQRQTDKEVNECKDKIAVLTKKNTLKDQQLQELEQGSRILEDQLRLMDEKFIDVRNKLDWTRATSQKETKKLQQELSSLRMKWQMASDAGLLTSLPEWAAGPKLSKKLTKPLGTSSSESRLPSSPTAVPSALLSNNATLRGSPQPEALNSAARRPRFEIPKLPQGDHEIGMPWSDAKLSALTRNLEEKRKG